MHFAPRILAFIDKHVVGHVWGEPVSLFVEGKIQEFGMVTLACVAPDLRRQGITTCLMERLHAYFPLSKEADMKVCYVP